MTTKAEVFIIESVDFKDEEQGRLDGKILSDLLTLCGKKPRYYYVRTEREFQEVLGFFHSSNYRYLHLSCHGSERTISTTLDTIDFPTLGKLLQPYLDDRRLFMSACATVNNMLAQAVMPSSGCLSIVGPSMDVDFDQAAVLWISFYQLMFRENRKGMQSKDIDVILDNLADLFELPLAYYRKVSNSTKGYQLKSY